MDINALRVACAKLNTLLKNYSWHGIKRLKLPNLTVLAKSDDVQEEQVEATLKSSVVLDMLEKLHMQSIRATLGHASHRDIFCISHCFKKASWRRSILNCRCEAYHQTGPSHHAREDRDGEACLKADRYLALRKVRLCIQVHRASPHRAFVIAKLLKIRIPVAMTLKEVVPGKL